MKDHVNTIIWSRRPTNPSFGQQSNWLDRPGNKEEQSILRRVTSVDLTAVILSRESMLKRSKILSNRLRKSKLKIEEVSLTNMIM